jgi:glycine reductase
MKRILMIYDQIQAGAGTKDDTRVPLAAKKEAVGPAVMMEPYLKQKDIKVIACLWCGTDTWKQNPEETVRKFCAMAKKLAVDGVIAGPCFNFADYAAMAAMTAKTMEEAGIPCISAMSKENASVIDACKKDIDIVMMPKKGETGLNKALADMVSLIHAKMHGQPKPEVCW